MDGCFSTGELGEALAAAATRRHQLSAGADDTHLGNLCFPGHDHRGDRGCFGAPTLRIGGVFDVCAGPDLAGGSAYGGADLEFGIGRVGQRPGRAGGLVDFVCHTAVLERHTTFAKFYKRMLGSINRDADRIVLAMRLASWNRALTHSWRR